MNVYSHLHFLLPLVIPLLTSLFMLILLNLTEHSLVNDNNYLDTWYNNTLIEIDLFFCPSLELS